MYDDTKSYYKLIVSTTECKKLANGIFDVSTKFLLHLLIARFVVL